MSATLPDRLSVDPKSLLSECFSESNARYLVEIAPKNATRLAEIFGAAPELLRCVGRVSARPVLTLHAGIDAVEVPVATLRHAFRVPECTA